MFTLTTEVEQMILWTI